MFKDIIQQLRENFPCAYGGPNRMQLLNQLLIVSGNGYGWTDDGHTIEYTCGGRIRQDKPKITAAELHAVGMSKLRTMPDFEPVTSTKSYGAHGMGGWRKAKDALNYPIDLQHYRETKTTHKKHDTKDSKTKVGVVIIVEEEGPDYPRLEKG